MEEKKDTLFSWLWRVIKGAIIGTGAILPGISGGVLSVVLGIYRPMMEFLSNPIKSFKKQYKFFLPIVIGFALGVVLVSGLVDLLFRKSKIPAVWLFIGLVLGTVPSLFKEAGEHGRGWAGWLSLIICGGLMYALLSFFGNAVAANVQPSLLWWFICGLLWGIGLIVPGMSPSSIFIYLGLYQPMSAGFSIKALDFSIILPIGVGLVVMILLLAKPIKYLFDKHYCVMYHGILGIVIASTLVIMPFGNASGTLDILLYAGCFIIGAVIAYFMEKASKKLDQKAEDK